MILNKKKKTLNIYLLKRFNKKKALYDLDQLSAVQVTDENVYFCACMFCQLTGLLIDHNFAWPIYKTALRIKRINLLENKAHTSRHYFWGGEKSPHDIVKPILLVILAYYFSMQLKFRNALFKMVRWILKD